MQEKDVGNSIYYILSGRVAVIHKSSYTYLDDLIVKTKILFQYVIQRDEYFGEIGFYTDSPRCATIKSRDFLELFVIDSDTFLQMADGFDEVLKLYHKVRSELLQKFDYTIINLECYICKEVGHIAIDCDEFEATKKGNLVKLYNQVYK